MRNNTSQYVCNVWTTSLKSEQGALKIHRTNCYKYTMYTIMIQVVKKVR